MKNSCDPPVLSESLRLEIDDLVARHHKDDVHLRKEARLKIVRFLREFDVRDGELGEFLVEVHFRRFMRSTHMQASTARAFVSALRSMAVTLHGERMELRAREKPARINEDTQEADIRAAAELILAARDAAAAGALIAVLCDVRLDHFSEITSVRELLDQQLVLPSSFSVIAEHLLAELPAVEGTRLTTAGWHRARIVDLAGRPQLRPMGIRILRSQLLATELGLPSAELLRHQIIFPIVRRDELTEIATSDSDWCRVIDQAPIADRLLDEVCNTERNENVASRPMTKTQARKRAKELAERHENPPDLPPSHHEWLMRYKPTAPAVAPYWNQIREPVIEVACRTQVRSLIGFKRMVAVLAAAFADAAANRRSLDPAHVLSERETNRFAAGMPGTDKTRTTYRSDLRRAARSWPGTGLVERPIEMPKTGVQPPYSAQQVRAAWRVVDAEPDSERGRRVKLLFGLGLGAGIKTGEIWQLRREHFRVIEKCDVLVIDVPPDREREARTVPVLSEWRKLIEHNLPDEPGPVITGTARNLTAITYGRIRSESAYPPLNQDRLRNTWLVAMMGSPDVSLATLLRIAGLRTARSLEGLVEYVPTNRTYDEILRAASGNRSA